MYYFEYLTLNRTKFVEGITLIDTNGLFLRFFGIYTLMEAHHGKAELLLHCQCCMRGVSFSNLEGSSNLLRDNNSSQIVHSSDNACCFHISFSFSVGTPVLGCPRTPQERCPYNNFTNYAVSICKQAEIIPQDLLFTFPVI